ncbi:hypothetical protein DLE60_25930 [Micromonospora globispora]|uniref:N-acetyltransferase domain-containing protein n=1 Tax=Micromonospora globispora TaxID=1450148 RepID=A0A317JRA9_9ACTN|nr:hypothetical protein DLJ46_31895 [Micromonospora globispora]PWU56652.1 hypothetical protein DLE60_25930 [Micromonospora globispora]RQX01160.1 hypothetical protein DKL51_05955 [Micromonospora globispora]
MRAAVEHLSRHWVHRDPALVVADNPRARRFYERFGFTLDGASRAQPVGSFTVCQRPPAATRVQGRDPFPR